MQPYAGLDRSFLGTIQGSFKDTGLSREQLVDVILVLLLVIAVLMLGIGVNWLRKKLHISLKPGVVTSPARIRRLLETALDQRSKFEMQFLPADQSRQTLFCSFLEIKDGNLFLEAPSGLKASRKWLEKDIQCYFRVVEGRDRAHFYTFTSRILGVKKLASDFLHLTISYPERLELHQKRSFLRLDPPPSYILGMALWPGKNVPGGDGEKNVKQWGKPVLAYIPKHQANPVKVDNLSGGGVRLDFHREAVKKAGEQFSMGNRFYMLLDVYEPEQKSKQRFFLQLRIQNVFEDFQTKNLAVGFKFTAWGKPAPDDPRTVQWRMVDEFGVDPIANWVMKRHLEMYREKGLV
jgi:hypothetical protein